MLVNLFSIAMRGFIYLVVLISTGLSLCLSNFKVRPNSGGDLIWSEYVQFYLHSLGPNLILDF